MAAPPRVRLPAERLGSRDGPLVVYLDQNYAVNLTLARYGEVDRLKDQFPKYLALYEMLKASVNSGVLVCPFSEFRDTESALFPESLGERIFETLAGLSNGAKFASMADILDAQVIPAFEQFVGRADVPFESFCREAIFVDTHTPISERPFWALANTTRQIRAHHERFGINQTDRTSAEERSVQETEFILNIYIRSFEMYLRGGSDSWYWLAAARPTNTLIRLIKTHEVGRGHHVWETLTRFLQSSNIKSMPIISIHAQLRAALLTSGNTSVKGSQLDDVLAVSTVLPYVDILTTDAQMKDLIRRTRSDEVYQVEVFGGRIGDVEGLTSRLVTLACLEEVS